jgi:hypothetical protein
MVSSPESADDSMDQPDALAGDSDDSPAHEYAKPYPRGITGPSRVALFAPRIPPPPPPPIDEQQDDDQEETVDEQNLYSRIEVDDDTRRRLKSVSKGQQQLRVDPQIDTAARVAPWNRIGWTKDRALDSLEGLPLGSFVIRGSDEYFGALSMIGPTGMYHVHIEKNPLGLHLKKSTQYFPCLTALVNYYRQSFQSDLPCPLRS